MAMLWWLMELKYTDKRTVEHGQGCRDRHINADLLDEQLSTHVQKVVQIRYYTLSYLQDGRVPSSCVFTQMTGTFMCYNGPVCTGIFCCAGNLPG